MSKFPPDGYTVIWETLRAVDKDPDTSSTSEVARFTNPLEAFERARKLSKVGYRVVVYQTINLQVFNSTKKEAKIPQPQVIRE